MTKPITPQQLRDKVGDHLGTSPWVRVDQPMIDAFADVTRDPQFIHVDPQAAAQTPFGGTIAHGFLTLSLLSHLLAAADKPEIAGVTMGVNYGFERVRFLAPVRSGRRVRGHFKLLDLEEKRPGQWQQRLECTVEIEGEDKPALIAEWIGQFFI
ncbi:MAG: MaoC family dehydratase [Sphingomonadales bacterium]|nr:MaoC family dehydratase [Sphingomonadales bacterium]